MVKIDRKHAKFTLIVLSFLAAVFIAFLARTYDYNREAGRIGNFVPFTLESAMMYSYARKIAENGYLPDKDKGLVGMDNIPINRQMSISMEYFLGYGYYLKNFFSPVKTCKESTYGDNSDFNHWARFQIRLWISLSAGLIFLWLFILRCSWVFSILGGILFAVSPAAIARATGQDLIRENFAIPIIMAVFVCYFWYLRKPKKYKLILFSLSVLGALASWDMVQLCFSVWGIFEIIRILFNTVLSGKDMPAYNKKSSILWLVFFAVSVFAGFFIPYLYEHKFLMSPFIVIILPSVVLLHFLKIGQWKKVLFGGGVIIILFCLWFFIFSRFGYAGNYSHFANLIKAKLYFGNLKPLNPLLLDIDSRILWTPGLHSATKTIFWTLFHLTFPVFIVLLAGILLFQKSREIFLGEFHRLSLPIFFTLFYFILFIFMVRFHALVIPFLAVSIALLFDNVSSLYRKGRIIFVIIFVLLIISEVEWFFKLSRKYYNNEKTNIELIEWFNLNPNIKDKTILADFTLSPMLKAYTDVRILLQPKFELGKTRNLVKEYLSILYNGNEQKLIDFCGKYKIDYFVFNKGLVAGGKTASILHPWSNRYMAAAFKLEEASPVYRCYYHPDRLRYLYRLDEIPKSRDINLQYAVFKVITPEKIKEAERLYLLAEDALTAENREKARKLIKSAVLLDPASVRIRYLYYRLFDNRWPFLTLNGLKTND